MKKRIASLFILSLATLSVSAFSTQSIVLNKTQLGFAPVAWELQPNSNPDMVRVTNQSGKTQTVFIQADVNSSPVDVIECGDLGDQYLYAGFSITCKIPDGKEIFWYIATDKINGKVTPAHGSYQIKTNA